MKYVVTGTATVTVKTIVDAISEEEAKLIADLECEDLVWTISEKSQLLEEITGVKRAD